MGRRCGVVRVKEWREWAGWLCQRYQLVSDQRLGHGIGQAVRRGGAELQQ